MEIQNYYKLLELREDYSCQELYVECKALFIKHHPSTNKSEVAFRKFIFVNDAYAMLFDEEVRRTYDYLLTKYSNDNPIGIEDKLDVEKLINLIIEKRRGIKDMLEDNDLPYNSILLEIPIYLSLNYSGGVSFKMLSFSDLDLDFDWLDIN